MENYKDVIDLIDSNIQKLNTEKEYLNEHINAQDPNYNIENDLNEMKELNNKTKDLHELQEKITTLKDVNAESRYEEFSDLSNEDINLLEKLNKEKIDDLYVELDLQYEFLEEENKLSSADIDPTSFNSSIESINNKIENIQSKISNLSNLNVEFEKAKELKMVEEYTLNESERVKALYDEMERNTVRFNENEIFNSLDNITKNFNNENSTVNLNDDYIFKVLSKDKELMEQAMLFYQQQKILTLLNQSKDQLNNVNSLIDRGIDQTGLKDIQSNLTDNIKSLKNQYKNIENNLILNKSNLVNEINIKVANQLEKDHQTNENDSTLVKPAQKKSNQRSLEDNELSL